MTAEPHQTAEAERVAVAQFTVHADSFASSPIINDAAFEVSLDTDGLGVDARRVDDRIRFAYPIVGFRLSRGV